MINPQKITNYNCKEYQLQEQLMFWVLVANKQADTISRSLDRLLTYLHGRFSGNPFDLIKKYHAQSPFGLADLLKSFGIGCQTIKAKALIDLVHRNLNLKTCSIDELEEVYGIGMKTSRCFLLHTRRNARCAGLDTHVRKWLRSLGYDIPNGSLSESKYLKFERIFLAIADALGMTPAELDLAIWNAYSAGEIYQAPRPFTLPLCA